MTSKLTRRIAYERGHEWVQPEDEAIADLVEDLFIHKGVGEIVEASPDDDWLASAYSLPVDKPGSYLVVHLEDVSG